MAWHKAATTDAVPDGGVTGVEINGLDIALYKLDGAFYATGNICTHQHAYMSDGYVDDGCIECPLHQALFDIRTGAVVDGPTKSPLPVYATKIDGDAILVELPD